MKNPTKIVREGKTVYSAPDLEALYIDIEQGFQASITSGNWDSALNPDRTWGYTEENELF